MTPNRPAIPLACQHRLLAAGFMLVSGRWERHRAPSSIPARIEYLSPATPTPDRAGGREAEPADTVTNGSGEQGASTTGCGWLRTAHLSNDDTFRGAGYSSRPTAVTVPEVGGSVSRLGHLSVSRSFHEADNA